MIAQPARRGRRLARERNQVTIYLLICYAIASVYLAARGPGAAMTTGWHRKRRDWNRAFPPPPAERKHKPRPSPAQVEQPRQRPGDCPFCGNICTPVEDWTCWACLVTYPGGVTSISRADGMVVQVEP